MKKLAILLGAISIAASTVGGSAIAAPNNSHANNGGGGRACEFGGYTASSPGHWFQYVLSDASGWNVPGARSIVAFLNYWWEATGGTNNAETVADFIQRDCSN
jgi:hypothetical protein